MTNDGNDNPLPAGPTASEGEAAAQAALAAVAQLQEAARSLVAGIGAERVEVSPDGTVEAVASAGRLTRVTMNPALERIGQSVDRPALQAQALQAIRLALGCSAVAAPLPRDVSAMPATPGMDPQTVLDFAMRSFTAADRDGAVTATVAGTGELTGLEFGGNATRGAEFPLLGERVVAAVQAASAQFTQARNDTFGLGDLEGALAEKVAAFEQRADKLIDGMAQTNAQLNARLGEMQELYAKRRR